MTEPQGSTAGVPAGVADRSYGRHTSRVARKLMGHATPADTARSSSLETSDPGPSPAGRGGPQEQFGVSERRPVESSANPAPPNASLPRSPATTSWPCGPSSGTSPGVAPLGLAPGGHRGREAGWVVNNKRIHRLWRKKA